MTRFQKELSGSLGPYWKKEAEKALAKIEQDLKGGQITVDENGVARNCIGRALMDDLLEQLVMVTRKANVEATRAARRAETEASLKDYRANKHAPSAEEIAEMRAAFGEGTTVTDVLTGESYQL